jgi:hypothetical protein
MFWIIVVACLFAFTFFRLGALSVLVTVLTTALQGVFIGLLVLAGVLALRALLRIAIRR